VAAQFGSASKNSVGRNFSRSNPERKAARRVASKRRSRLDHVVDAADDAEGEVCEPPQRNRDRDRNHRGGQDTRAARRHAAPVSLPAPPAPKLERLVVSTGCPWWPTKKQELVDMKATMSATTTTGASIDDDNETWSLVDATPGGATVRMTDDDFICV
jgi:hypothetical protein